MGLDRRMVADISVVYESTIAILVVAQSPRLRRVHHSSTRARWHQPLVARMDRASSAQVLRNRGALLHHLLVACRSARTATRCASRSVESVEFINYYLRCAAGAIQLTRIS